MMPISNRDLMDRARLALRGRWGQAVVATLIYLLCLAVFQVRNPYGLFPRQSVWLSLLFGGPLHWGFNSYFLRFSRGQEVGYGELFSGFRHFGKSLLAYVSVLLLVALGLVLLVVPGIVFALQFGMIYYVMNDHPDLPVFEAMDKSKALMQGQKMRLFRLYLRFALIVLLCVITLGVALLWAIPYIQVTLAGFYEQLRAGKES